MFANVAKAALIAATLLTGLAGVAQAGERSGSASVVLADHRDGHWDRRGERGGYRDGGWDRGERRHDGWGERRGDDRFRGRHESRRAEACEPGRALRKAARMGVRGGDIVRLDRRTVVVAGFKRGHPTAVRFAQAPGCPVIGYR
ncbi:hypothetical protein [Aureimonas sp. AU12]|uniref:hypothetical protein n=1 Tax=Aureimonas sp. AU12 TaxID=1638161 RepID=UPI0007849E08|nr:hypothetical protein [Aureimonas sp. AU12]